LSRAFTFWILSKKKQYNADPSAVDSYSNDLKAVATFDTVEDFWATYQHLCRVNTMKFGTTIHLVIIEIYKQWLIVR
jgi:hypothetical protein